MLIKAQFLGCKEQWSYKGGTVSPQIVDIPDIFKKPNYSMFTGLSLRPSYPITAP